jgi:putative phosphoesterase
LVVVADTHGRPHSACGAHIADRKPDYIVHAGDIGDLVVLDELAGIAPVLAVRGNIDAPVASIPEALTIEFTDGRRSLLKLLVVHIGVIGPKLRGDVADLARSEGASMVFCGHSHVPFVGVDKGLGIFNPGSVGPRRFQLPIVFGVFDIERQGFRLQHVDCETGETWLP